MAIEFNCPHCQHQYRLKDELAGKSATCKGCRQKITIPQPITVPPDAPVKSAAEIEAEALAAMADEPAKVEETAANKIIDVECGYCNHKWTEPITRAGKNALCAECKQRVKIPEPKDEGQYDWRQTKTKGPSMAKDNQLQKPSDVQDAGDLKQVSGTALKEAGAIEDDTEPRPLKEKILYAGLALGLLAGLVFGAIYMMRSRTEGKEDRLMKESHEEFVKAPDALPKDDVPVAVSLMHAAAGEHLLRHDTKEKFKEGMDLFAKSREALRPVASPARNAAVADLAVAMLSLGGTEEQARDQIRLRWMPDATLKTRPNERVFTVFEELSKTLDLVQSADPEFRNHLARRLARELVKRGQATMAVELVPRALFNPTEQPEARAIVALEVYRADPNSELPRKIATELVALRAELVKPPQPASVQTLFIVLKIDKPVIVSLPLAGGTFSEAQRYAYTGSNALENNGAEALKIAQAPGKPESQLRCMTLLADWSADPAPALDAAWGVIVATAGKKDVTLSQSSIFRLSQIAAAAGRHDQAKQFADKLTDDGLKAWAKGDTIRARLSAAPKEKGDESWSELPDDPKKFRAGHALGRLWIARQNTKLSGDRTAEVKTVSAWPAPFSLFGKAGVALGLQDREK